MKTRDGKFDNAIVLNIKILRCFVKKKVSF